MRQLYLVNEVGTSYFFDERTNTLISEIDDLGFSNELTCVTYKDERVVREVRSSEMQINLTLVFTNGYADFTNFIEFKKKSKGQLRLFYKINGDVKFCNVAIKALTKTQLDHGSLTCILTLEKLTIWLKKKSYTIRVSEDTTGKTYPYRYSYMYSFTYSGSVDITNDGEAKAPMNVLISGAVKNPRVDFYKGDVLVGSIKILVESSGCEIEVSSDYSNQYIKLREGGVESNIYALQDFTYDNFIYLETGSYTVVFTPGVTADSSCRVSYVEGYSGH